MPALGVIAVQKYGDIVEEEARREGIDPDLVKAIMFHENGAGNYAGLARPAEIAKRALGRDPSLFPMNIKAGIWGDLVSKDPTLKSARANIRAGVRLVKGLRDRIVDPTPEKIATLYGATAADEVRDSGAFVGRILREKPWKKLEILDTINGPMAVPRGTLGRR